MLGVGNRKPPAADDCGIGGGRSYLGCRPCALVFVFVEEEVLVAWVVGPDVFDALVDFAVVLDFLQVLDDFEWCAGARSVVYELILGGWPGGVLEFRG